jgi:hypothetical protein
MCLGVNATQALTLGALLGSFTSVGKAPSQTFSFDPMSGLIMITNADGSSLCVQATDSPIQKNTALTLAARDSNLAVQTWASNGDTAAIQSLSNTLY